MTTWVLDEGSIAYNRCEPRYASRINDAELRAAGFRRAGYGRHRATYFTPSHRYVIKFPVNCSGEYANRAEAIMFANGWPHAARCRLITYRGLPCLLMEVVTRNVNRNDIPPAVRHIDGGQVGRNRDGEIRCFDFATEFYNIYTSGFARLLRDEANFWG